MSTIDKYTNQASATTNPDWNHLPSVQYGYAEEKGPIREPILRTIFDPIPEGANTASPIYKVPLEQYENQEDLENPYAIKGNSTIAKEIQDEAEDDDRVLYPIHVESDAFLQEGPTTLIGWFREFVGDHLEVPFHTCKLYYSGNRSIHVHVPRFVSGETQRQLLKEEAEAFCDESGADLDVGLYSRKRLFRLPGVKHQKTDLHKVEIQPDWERDRIIREAATWSSGTPATYEEVLREVYASQEALTTDFGVNTNYSPQDIFRVLDSEKTVLELSSEESKVEVPLIERQDWPDDSRLIPKYAQYNAKEFSPYALCKGGSRSVAALRVEGSPFAKIDKTIGHSNRRIHALIPAYFHGARGCAGADFTKDEEHAPLQLSKRDYRKWDYEEGDHIVIIGGKSNSSRIIPVEPREVKFTGHALTGPEGNRQNALEYLQSEGYEVGSAGRTAPVNAEKSPKKRPNQSTQSKPMGDSAAKKLQTIAEEKGIESLYHEERWRVACRLLKFGWDSAWSWFREQYGSGFDRSQTRSQFESVLNSYPDDYGHIEVPDSVN